MSSKSLQQTTTGLLFIVLAIMDTIVLWVGLLRQWLVYAFKIQDVRLVADASCKLHTFLVYWISHLASWLLVCIACERFFVVFYPFRAKRVASKRNALLFVLLIAFILFATNVQLLWSVELIFYNENKEWACHESDKYHYFALRIWPWIDFSLFSLAPFAILAVANLSIAGKLIHMNYIRGRRLHKNSSNSRIGNLTVVNFAVSAWFLVTTLPISVFLIKQHVWILNETHYTQKIKVIMQLVWAVTANISYLNNSCNFVLYIMTSRRFRSELVALFRRRGNQHPIEHV